MVDKVNQNTAVKIAYLINPDPVFFNELDYKIMDHLKKLGAEVFPITLDESYFAMNSDGVKYFYKGAQLDVDAMLCYGYMSPKHMEQYIYLLIGFESMNKVCIHSERVTRILDNKLLQGFQYSKHGVQVPDTFYAPMLPGVREFYKNFTGKSVIKKLSDYGGDGVKLSKHPDEGVTTISKLQWVEQASLTQRFVPDSVGRSIRVLCMKGKPYACAEYQDLSSDFRSNVSYHENFQLVSQMNNEKIKQYYEAAEKAVQAIDPNLTIGGVDLLDSPTKGILVLEVNCWPDLYDIEASTKLPIFDQFVQVFYQKVVENKAKFSK